MSEDPFETIFPGPDKPRGKVTLSSHADAVLRNEVVVRAEQEIPATTDAAARTIAAWIPVTRHALVDAAFAPRLLEGAFDRWLRPWRFPDPNPMPTFVPFPRVDRLTQRAKALRRRVADWRHRVDEEDEW